MKDYKEIAREVFARRDEYQIKQKKRRKAVAAIASTCAVLCAVIAGTLGYGNMQNKLGVADTSPTGWLDSIMVTPTVPTTSPSEPLSDDDPDEMLPTYSGVYGDSDKGYAGTVADRAGVQASDVVVYGEIVSFQQIGTDILCTLTVEKTLKGEESATVSFNISEEDRSGFMALIKGEKAVFFLREDTHGLSLTHGSPSIFYEAGEDDFRSYDETGLICFNLTMKEIERLTEAGA